MNTFSKAVVTAAVVFGSRTAQAEDYNNAYQQFTVCDTSDVVVEQLSILCDSPGQYYYGGSSYRDSVQCKGGDKVKYTLQVAIPYEMPETTVPYLTLEVQGYGAVESVRVYDSEALCEIDDLWSLDGAACPNPGQYQLEGYFYFGEQWNGDDGDYTFKPKMEVGIASRPYANTYDLGGANTKSCGFSISTWSKRLSGPMHAFVITMSIFAGVAICAAVALYCFCKRRQNRAISSKDKEAALMDASDNISPEEDAKRMAMMRQQQDLIDA